MQWQKGQSGNPKAPQRLAQQAHGHGRANLRHCPRKISPTRWSTWRRAATSPRCGSAWTASVHPPKNVPRKSTCRRSAAPRMRSPPWRSSSRQFADGDVSAAEAVQVAKVVKGLFGNRVERGFRRAARKTRAKVGAKGEEAMRRSLATAASSGSKPSTPSAAKRCAGPNHRQPESRIRVALVMVKAVVRVLSEERP